MVENPFRKEGYIIWFCIWLAAVEILALLAFPGKEDGSNCPEGGSQRIERAAMSVSWM
jgi:hypothetical protein